MLLRLSAWFVAFGLFSSVNLFAEQIDGVISAVANGTCKIATDSERLPSVGDKLKIFVEISGVGRAQVGTATISKVDGIVVSATITNATGRVAVGQLVAITSTNRPAPPSIAASQIASRLKGPPAESREIATLISKMVRSQHLSAHPIDDEISQRMFDLLLRTFDPKKLYFYQADITELRKLRFELGDLYQSGDLSFSYTVFNRFLSRVAERLPVVEELLDLEHDFSVPEYLVSDEESLTYPRDIQEAREQMRLRVKYDLLVEAASGSTQEEALHKVRHKYRAQLVRYQRFTDENLLSVAYNLLPVAYDPNSHYFSAKQLEEFTIQGRQQMVGIGAALREVDGAITTTQIIAGSPSHHDGRLQVGDRIVAVGQGRGGELVDITGMPLTDVVALIRGNAGTSVRLRVVPRGAFESTVYEITRAKFTLASAAGTVLSGDSLPGGRDAKLGFIHLPSFYYELQGSAASDNDARSASRDVRRILADFSAQEVDIAVLDLRTNSGGSLNESLNVSGLFIGEGPLLQTKGRDGTIEQYDDPQEDIAWDKPLVVLTSGRTAGGGEILAGALQDYGRALIVGDSHTNGSGTVQNLSDLAEALSDTAANPRDLGKLKLTIQRFYRPLGRSTQLKGVTPDVVVPSMIDVLAIREEQKQYPLQFDVIAPETFGTVDFGIDEKLVGSLRSRNELRRSQSPYFQKLDVAINANRRWQTQKRISLQMEPFFESYRQLQFKPEETPVLPKIPDVKFDDNLRESFNVSLDYLAHLIFADAETDYQANRLSEAIRKYKLAVTADPSYLSAHYKLAWTLATGQIRDGRLAVTHAEKAVELDQGRRWAYRLALAVAHAEAGDFESAQKHLTIALDMASESERATYSFLEQRFRNRQTYSP